MAENCWRVWGTPANFNWFRVLATLPHGTPAVGVSQILRHWTEGATYIWQGGHHVGHWPIFLVSLIVFVLGSGLGSTRPRLLCITGWHHSLHSVISYTANFLILSACKCVIFWTVCGWYIELYFLVFVGNWQLCTVPCLYSMHSRCCFWFLVFVALCW